MKRVKKEPVEESVCSQESVARVLSVANKASVCRKRKIRSKMLQSGVCTFLSESREGARFRFQWKNPSNRRENSCSSTMGLWEKTGGVTPDVFLKFDSHFFHVITSPSSNHGSATELSVTGTSKKVPILTAISRIDGSKTAIPKVTMEREGGDCLYTFELAAPVKKVTLENVSVSVEQLSTHMKDLVTEMKDLKTGMKDLVTEMRDTRKKLDELVEQQKKTNELLEKQMAQISSKLTALLRIMPAGRAVSPAGSLIETPPDLVQAESSDDFHAPPLDAAADGFGRIGQN